MHKLIRGIRDFRKNVRPGRLESFAKLALGQRPDVLMVACSDSRVAPNVFASTDPGDLFVVRNVGNLVPGAQRALSASDTSVPAAIEFSLGALEVKHIIVCGHSECGAINAIFNKRAKQFGEHLDDWLKNGSASLQDAVARIEFADGLSDENKLSQLNVLKQIENLKSHVQVSERVKNGTLELHAWWFDIKNADVMEYDSAKARFCVIGE